MRVKSFKMAIFASFVHNPWHAIASHCLPAIAELLVVHPRWPSAAILDLIELQIAPFDPATPKTIA